MDNVIDRKRILESLKQKSISWIDKKDLDNAIASMSQVQSDPEMKTGVKAKKAVINMVTV